MADSLSNYLATEIIEWLANAEDFDTAPDTLYVSVEDDTDTDLSDDLQNAPVGIGSSDWVTSDTTFKNDTDVNLGEASANLDNVETITIYDGSDPGEDNLLLETPITNGPFDVSDGTELIFESGDIEYDAVEESA